MKNEKWRTKNDNEKIKMVSKYNLPNNGCWFNDKHYFEEFFRFKFLYVVFHFYFFIYNTTN